MRSLSRNLLGASSGNRFCRLQPAPCLALSLKSLFPNGFVSIRARCVYFILSANFFPVGIALQDHRFFAHTSHSYQAIAYMRRAASYGALCDAYLHSHQLRELRARQSAAFKLGHHRRALLWRCAHPSPDISLQYNRSLLHKRQRSKPSHTYANTFSRHLASRLHFICYLILYSVISRPRWNAGLIQYSTFGTASISAVKRFMSYAT